MKQINTREQFNTVNTLLSELESELGKNNNPISETLEVSPFLITDIECAWCGKRKGTEFINSVENQSCIKMIKEKGRLVSHAMCRECKKNLLADYSESIETPSKELNKIKIIYYPKQPVKNMEICI